jgi:hypothetical protein
MHIESAYPLKTTISMFTRHCLSLMYISNRRNLASTHQLSVGHRLLSGSINDALT